MTTQQHSEPAPGAAPSAPKCKFPVPTKPPARPQDMQPPKCTLPKNASDCRGALFRLARWTITGTMSEIMPDQFQSLVEAWHAYAEKFDHRDFWDVWADFKRGRERARAPLHDDPVGAAFNYARSVLMEADGSDTWGVEAIRSPPADKRFESRNIKLLWWACSWLGYPEFQGLVNPDVWRKFFLPSRRVQKELGLPDHKAAGRMLHFLETEGFLEVVKRGHAHLPGQNGKPGRKGKSTWYRFNPMPSQRIQREMEKNRNAP